MAIRPDWEVGTITLVAGSLDFTTTNSALQTAAISAGDEIITPAGLVLIISEITGQNAGHLMLPCPAGAAGDDQPLRIRYQPDGSRMQGAMRMVRELLVTGNLDAFAALEARPNSVPVFTGFGALGLMDTDMLGGGSAGAWDAMVFDLAGLDAYADRPAAYRVMVIDAGGSRSAVFQKVTNAAGDWSQPIYFTGKDGKAGEQGEAGNDFEPDAIGLLSERSAYDNEPAGFAFLATDAAALYFRQGAAGEWSAPIPFGAGKPGEKGDDGLSAYQVAVQEGFAGTQTEWIASLKGRDGDPGRQGEPGKDGEPGQKGDPGKNGTDASVTEQSIRSAGGAIRVEVDAIIIGIGQTWHDVTTQRVVGTVYQNTTGRPIEVAHRYEARNGSAFSEISADNVTWIRFTAAAANAVTNASAIVPNNWYYRILGAGVVHQWSELRSS